MKKTLVILIQLLFLVGCSDDSDLLSPSGQKHFRLIAYESLSESEQSTIIDWQNGKVEAGTYQSADDSHSIVLDSQNRIPFATNSSGVKLFDGQKLIAVTFETKVDALLGPIILIIEPCSENVIGYMLRM